MAFEVFGLGILFPIVLGLLDISHARSVIDESIPILKSYTDSVSNDTLLMIGLVSLVVIYAIKSAYLVFLNYYQNHFLVSVTKKISNNLYSHYLSQKYSYFFSKNSSDIIRIFQIELNYLISYLTSFFFVITELSFVIAGIGTLLFIDPLGALAVGGFLGIMSSLFYILINKRLTQYGKLREEFDGKISKNILQTIESIKEIKIRWVSLFFEKTHFAYNSKKSNLTLKQLVIGQLPRLYLEFVAVIGLTGFITFLLYRGFRTEELITIVSVFVAASFRMIPSLNRIINGVQNIRFYQSSIDVINKEFNSFQSPISTIIPEDKNNLSVKKEICLKGVSFRYDETTEKILNELNLKIKIGTSVGIIGGSGSGKSTLLDIMIGLIYPQKGSIYIDGEEVTNQNIYNWQKSLGYVNQHVNLIDDTITKNIAFGIDDDKIDFNKLSNCIQKAQLYDFVESLPSKEQTVIGEKGVKLSGGQRQRIGIARALYNDPEVLLFDEATSALDEKTETQFMNAIEKFRGNKTIIVVTHRLSTLTSCDAIYSLDNGKLSSVNASNYQLK